MKAGKLTQRITIQQEVKKTTDANQRIGEWVDVCTVWAEHRATSSTVLDGNGFVVHAGTHKFYIRRREGITAQMRVKWKGRIFELQGPPVDWESEPNGLTLITKELV
jgi:SPP1 family predicted phage head-tail adaptor